MLHLTDKTAGMLTLGCVEQYMGRKKILLLTSDNIRSSRAFQGDFIKNGREKSPINVLKRNYLRKLKEMIS